MGTVSVNSRGDWISCYAESRMEDASARIITVLNRKGGVGKTHVCWLAASVALERGQRTLLVDLDPQGNLSGSFLKDDAVSPGVEQLFDPSSDINLRSLIRRTEFAGIDLVPSSGCLESFNLTESAEWEATDLQLVLAEALPDAARDYDLILLDCPPSLSLTSTAALCASDFVIIPLEAARWGALGTQRIVAAMETIQHRFNSRLQLLGYVVSRFKARRAYQQTYLTELRKHFGDDAFEEVIPDLAAFEKAVTDRVPLTLHSPTSHASRIARRFFDELEARSERLARSRRTVGQRRLRKPASVSV